MYTLVSPSLADSKLHECVSMIIHVNWVFIDYLRNNYTPRKLCLWVGILFSRCPSVRSSVTFCFLNIFKIH